MTSTPAPVPSTAPTLAPENEITSEHLKEVDQSGMSTQRSSYLDFSIKKEEDAASTDIENGVVVRAIGDKAVEGQDEEEYPKSFQLLMVVIALVLSIFLVALDMVSCLPHHSSLLVGGHADAPARLLWRLRFQKSQTSSTD